MITIRTLNDVLDRAGLTDAIWLHIPPGRGDRLNAWQRVYLQGAAALEAETRIQRGRNFQGAKHIVMLIPFDDQDRYLFAGVYRVLSDDRPERTDAAEGVYYEVLNELTPILSEWNGRLVFKWSRPLRGRYLKAETAAADLALVQVRELAFGTDDVRFPGYYGFHLDRVGLEAVFRAQLPAWKAALSSVAAVYAISDTATGDVYVGSAYGQQGLWSRWEGYANTLHNGNKLLKAHVEANTAANLEYSVLLTMDIRSNKDEVFAREGFFKRALGTRIHGLNAN